jgi:hypothetical protein
MARKTTISASAPHAQRAARLKAALKANIARRKTQAQARAEVAGSAATGDKSGQEG